MARVCLAIEAMRSRFELVLEGENRDSLQAAGEEAIAEILTVERLLHPFAPSSDLARASGSLSPTRISGSTLTFLRTAQHLALATDGAFDLTASSSGGGFVLEEEDGTVALLQEGARLDPGALGKGWALDRAAELLRDAGVDRALLHGGTSSVVAIGCSEGETGWKVAVCNPASPESFLETIVLCDESLSVSSNFERPHIVDPRTGEPVGEIRLAVVRAASATEAEALSTALLVLGHEGIPLLARRFPGATFSLFP